MSDRERIPLRLRLRAAWDCLHGDSVVFNARLTVEDNQGFLTTITHADGHIWYCDFSGAWQVSKSGKWYPLDEAYTLQRGLGEAE